MMIMLVMTMMTLITLMTFFFFFFARRVLSGITPSCQARLLHAAVTGFRAKNQKNEIHQIHRRFITRFITMFLGLYIAKQYIHRRFITRFIT